MHSQPPRWTDKLLRWFCEPRLHEEVQGDLHELYGKWVAERGVKRANRRYVLAVLGFIRPFALKQNPSLQPKPPYMAMLRNYLTIALRNLQKNRVHSCINLAGLAFTSAFCLLVYTFVRHELSFDRFHRKAPQIYRVEFAGMNLAESGTKSFLSNLTTPDNSRLVRLPPGLAPELKDNFPEITQRFRFREQKNLIIGVNGEKHVQEDSHLVDSNFFQLFSFRLVAGNPQTALNDPQSVVLSQATARQYFGDGNPIGQTIEVFREIESSLFTVSGIAENPPANSSIDYQILFPFDAKGLSRADEAPERSMRMLSTLSLIELDVNTNLPEFQAKVSAFARGYYADELTAMNRPADQFQINLTPLADTHLDTIPWGWPRMGKKLNLYVLGLITLLILVIASLNYVFLALTQASARLQEVGIRKVNGASRGQLILQFWAETFVLVAIAVGAGYLAAMALLPAFSQLLDSPMDAQLLHSLPVGMSALGLAVLLSVLTGIYPALLISRFNPTRLLQRNRTYRINPGLSRVMVVVQYALCLFLVISTVVMREQFRFITEKNLGFDQENVVVINLMENHSLSQGAVLLERFRRLAAAEPDILAVSGGDNMTGSSAIGFYSFRDQPLVINKLTGDYAFTDMLGLEIIRGRNISPLFPTDTLAPGSVVINERLAEILGNECPVGGPCSVLNNVTVVGIVKDFHCTSLSESIKPALLQYNSGYIPNILLKIRPGDLPATLATIEAAWKQYTNGQPLTYTFMDEAIAQMYEAQNRWMDIIGTATGFAIFIACLGLFGLSGLNAVNRTKEIGIRKVLGASVSQIFLLLNLTTVRLAAISFLIAAPVAYYFAQQWLHDFAYRIELGWPVFAVAGVLGLLIVLSAVSYYSIKAASANPVESLRSE